MSTKERILTIRLLNKALQQPAFAETLGLRVSVQRKERTQPPAMPPNQINK